MITSPNGNPTGSYGYHQWDKLEVGDAIIVSKSYGRSAARHLNKTRKDKLFEACTEHGITKVMRVQ